ncbi:cytochrome P450 [Rhizobium leguminosarum]|nr:cytochrome P450 [Rhizobium leguminosarum]
MSPKFPEELKRAGTNMEARGEPMTTARASLLDTFRIIRTVMAPTIAKGVIKRRPSMEALAQRHDLDAKAVRLMQCLRKTYGRGPLLVPLPFRPQLLLLDPHHVAEALEGTPMPFTPASKEKRSALAHFEPGNVLISNASRRAELRPLHEHALATNERVHPFVEHFDHIVREELQALLPLADTGIRCVSWDEFSQSWFRIVRRIVLGDSAREDDQLTNDLDDLRRRANWAFAAFANKGKLKRYQKRVAEYLRQPEPGSLISRLPNRPEVDPESQVAQWLFAFDAAGIATFRALALLGCQPDEQARAVEEADAAAADRPFSRAVLIDAVRLWPTTPAILRELTEDHIIGGQTIRKGTGIIIFAPFFHRDDERLDIANRMTPATWIATESKPSVGLVPFSGGAAICPAHNLVPTAASLAMGAILSKATISVAEPSLDPEQLPGSLDHFEIKIRLSNRQGAAA